MTAEGLIELVTAAFPDTDVYVIEGDMRKLIADLLAHDLIRTGG